MGHSRTGEVSHHHNHLLPRRSRHHRRLRRQRRRLPRQHRTVGNGGTVILQRRPAHHRRRLQNRPEERDRKVLRQGQGEGGAGERPLCGQGLWCVRGQRQDGRGSPGSLQGPNGGTGQPEAEREKPSAYRLQGHLAEQRPRRQPVGEQAQRQVLLMPGVLSGQQGPRFQRLPQSGV